MSEKKKAPDAVAVKLIERFGCHACRHQEIEDDFLTKAGRFWCKKGSRSIDRKEKAHLECPDWAFGGDKELLASVGEDTPKLPFSEDPPGEKG